MTKQSFPLAPMSGVIAGLTVVVLLIPAVLWATGQPVIAAAVVALYALVWLIGRPTRFEVGTAGIEAVFPARKFCVPRRELAGVSVLNREQFRERFGTSARVGAGGLWGGFGWLWTSNEGLIDMYISRVDLFVVVERHDGKPLLITPADSKRFVEAVKDLLPNVSP